MELDELLAKPAHSLNANEARNVYLLALRAVVELSKPYLAGEVYVNPEFNQGVMAAFRLVIDAIEKELN